MGWPWWVSGRKYRELQTRAQELNRALRAAKSKLSAANEVKANAVAEAAAKATGEATANAERDLDALRQKHERDMQSLRLSYKSEADQREWCPPQWAELAPEVCKKHPMFAEATVHALRDSLQPPVGGMTSLVGHVAFRSPSMWALYWTIAHGAKAVCRRLPVGINENGLTVGFVEALGNAAEEYGRRFPDAIDLQIGAGKLFEHTDDNLQEVDAGADLVLVVSGQQLTPGGGARLLWFQAKKRRRGENPWLLSYKQANSKHVTQCAALKRRHVPSCGSFGSYVNYADAVPHVAAVPVEVLDEDGTSANVNHVGVRLQEHVLSRATSLEAGQFTSAEDVFDFITDGNSSSGLPIEVVTLDSPDSGLGQQVVAKIDALDRQRRQERNRGQGYGLG